MAVFFVGRLFGLGSSARILDWGGGEGLLVRLLRDVGLPAYHWDKYAENLYAIGFEGDPADQYAMITAFEVYEHFANPREEIDAIFEHRPEVHLLSTSLYRGQGDEWPYLNPGNGRHVFFYSREALSQIAYFFGYRALVYPTGIALFHRKRLAPHRKWLLGRLFSSAVFEPDSRRRRLFRSYFALLPKHSLVLEDYHRMRMVDTDDE
jgi:hypothetical protein